MQGDKAISATPPPRSPCLNSDPFQSLLCFNILLLHPRSRYTIKVKTKVYQAIKDDCFILLILVKRSFLNTMIVVVISSDFQIVRSHFPTHMVINVCQIYQLIVIKLESVRLQRQLLRQRNRLFTCEKNAPVLKKKRKSQHTYQVFQIAFLKPLFNLKLNLLNGEDIGSPTGSFIPRRKENKRKVVPSG